MTFLADNLAMESVLFEARDWDEAEVICQRDGLDLVGQYVGTYDPEDAEAISEQLNRGGLN